MDENMNEKEKTINRKTAGKFNIIYKKIEGKQNDLIFKKIDSRFKIFILQKKVEGIYNNLVLQKLLR